jgi:hypothetical protein
VVPAHLPRNFEETEVYARSVFREEREVDAFAVPGGSQRIRFPRPDSHRFARSFRSRIGRRNSLDNTHRKLAYNALCGSGNEHRFALKYAA